MADWTPEALAAEAEKRAEAEAAGTCPDSGLTIAACWESDLCDCAWGPPASCLDCHLAVWDMADHERRQHQEPQPEETSA